MTARTAKTTGRTGAYRLRLSRDPADVLAAQRLRHRCFRGRAGVDSDAFDRDCEHLLVEAPDPGTLVATCRLRVLTRGDVGTSYSAQFYDLANLQGFGGRMMEIGRFCVDPAVGDADILRLVWGALARLVESRDIGLLFGCTSFAGTQAAVYADSFALLAARHLAPPALAPRPKAPLTVDFAVQQAGARVDMKQALRHMPPLLRSYLAMGGWVSDHAVVDKDLGTLHVFTGVEIAAIPPARKRLMLATGAAAEGTGLIV